MSRPRMAALCLCLLTGLLADVSAQSPQPPPPQPGADEIAVKLPGNPINEVLSLYEMLTGKRMIRDANLAGPNLTVVVPGTVPKADAIALLESSMLLNGYTLVDVDDTTMKIIGPGKSPLGEGIPLYVDPSSLPTTEKMVSYFMTFRYISAKEAREIFADYVTPRQQGKTALVPNANALVITDNTPFIRRLINLQHMIDVPSAKVLTEFVPLTRANAEDVAELVNKLLEEEKQKKDAGQPSVDPQSPPPNPGGAPGQGQTPTVSTSSTQVLADVRTNRILIVSTEGRMPYLRKLVEDLDVAVDVQPPLTWPLKFVAAGEVLPVLQSILFEGDEKDAPTASNTPGASQSGDNSPFAQSDSSGGGFGSSGSGSSSGGTKPDKLKAPQQETGPIAVSVGKVRIIADRSANKIIVIGPPESKTKAANVLAILDQKPKQIYLATVIGELTLGKGMDLGIQYPASTQVSINVTGNNGNINTSTSASSNNGNNGSLINDNGNLDIIPGTSEMVNSAFQIASGAGLPFLSGLSLYGVVGDSIDLYVKALQSTNNFKVISRPVVYTANNKKAVISSGQQVPVPESTLSSQGFSNNVSASVASTVTYKDVVLKLEVIPLINSNDEVTLTIAQQNDNIRGNTTVADNTVPIIGTQELTTTVTVPNRHTVVLGGLITEEETVSRTGLPLLSSIPIIGYAFGQKSKQKTRRELIIMIQPFIINSAADEAEANYIERSMQSLDGELYQDKIPVRKAEPVTAGDEVIKPVKPWKRPLGNLSPMGTDP